MGVILDTCVFIAAEKQKINFSRIEKSEETFITAVTASELLVGVQLADVKLGAIKDQLL